MALALFVTLPSQVGPSVTCAPSTELTAPPYLFKCTDGTHYDLTTAHQLGAHSGYLTATDTEEHSYYFGVAAAVTTVTCDDPINNPIAIQTWGQPQPPSFPSYQCATIGTKESQACVIGENEPGNTGPPPLSCEYTGGSDGRTVAVKYVCGMTQSLPTAKQEGQSHYIISMVGPSLCRQVTGGDEGWQWGDTITLLFFLFSFFYVFGGGLYNVKYNGATPWTKEGASVPPSNNSSPPLHFACAPLTRAAARRPLSPFQPSRIGTTGKSCRGLCRTGCASQGRRASRRTRLATRGTRATRPRASPHLRLTTRAWMRRRRARRSRRATKKGSAPPPDLDLPGRGDRAIVKVRGARVGGG